ncbi:hypothetical protein K1T71_012612 [Dendrolimus kikuchii]|uniref:Uncharacterized protein n=1 Tax=Dendrolimus kikuchii TaxID=765133 RepID=A0ACC1CK93_9NEOP|nr:hypothetical protein K1T71_012612 [Dendrolimus kikuchii]
MDTKVSKNDNASDNSVQNVIGSDAVRSTDNVSICMECDEEKPTVNDLSQLNDTMIQSEGAPLEYDPETRNDFVRKVFFILTIMMLFTFLIVIAIYVTPLKPIFAKYGVFFVIPAAIMVMAMSYAFACSQCSRNPPCNYMCLLITVISMSIICAFITMRYDTKIIIYALLATVIAVTICTFLALTKFDFTSWLLYVVIIALALSAVTMILAVAKFAFGFYMKPLHIAILIAGLIMNCVMLVIELQMVLGGKSVELSEDDYALGAFMIYMSIIEMFLHLIKLIGLLSED